MLTYMRPTCIYREAQDTLETQIGTYARRDETLATFRDHHVDIKATSVIFKLWYYNTRASDKVLYLTNNLGLKHGFRFRSMTS